MGVFSWARWCASFRGGGHRLYDGIAVLIGLSQVKDFLGLAIPRMPGDFFGILGALYGHLHTFNPWAVGLALASLAIVVGWQRALRAGAAPPGLARLGRGAGLDHRAGAGHRRRSGVRPAGRDHRQPLWRHSGGAARLHPAQLQLGIRPAFC